MEPRTLEFDFGTSQPKMPFIFFVQQAPNDYTIRSIKINCNVTDDKLKCFTEIGYDPNKMFRAPFTPNIDTMINVSKGQLLRVIISVKEFVPQGVNGRASIAVS